MSDKSRNTRNNGNNNKNHNGNGKPGCDKPKSGRNLNRNNSTRREREAEEVGGTMSRMNDVSWYRNFPTFAQTAATLPFSTPVGAVLDIRENLKFSVPGLMSINFYPTIGVSKDFQSPINRSSIRFWTYVRSTQKASAAYDHQDITMMIMAIDSCLMFHSLMRRVYGLINLFTPVNKYYPKALLAANGVNFNDIIHHLSDFQAYINRFAYNLGQYALPKDIDLFYRHQWMCEGLYTDSNTTKAQTYMFVPRGFWQYDNTVETGSQLTYKDWLGTTASPKLHTYEEIVAFGDALINAISGDQDFAFISGDMYAFYKGNVLTVPDTPLEYRVLPAYNQTVLSQIENADIAGAWASDYTPVISQQPTVNEGAIIFTPKFASSNKQDSKLLGRTQRFVNMHVDAPTPDQVLEATRLTLSVKTSNTTGNTEVIQCGTEVVSTLSIWYINPDTGAYRFTTVDSTTQQLNPNSLLGDVRNIVALAQFDWAPLYELFWAPTDDQPTEFIGFSSDLDNFAPIKDEYLAVIHEAALLSLFDVKQR